MEEIIEWFGDHDYTIHEIKGGYRTEPVRLGVSMWALYNFEQVEDQVRIGAYWSKGPSVFSPNYKKNRENESYTPELSTFEQAIFRDRGSKSSHVIENLVAIMEDAGSGLVLHTLLTQDGDRQYAEIVYSADTTLTPEEEEAIEKLEKEREAQENYVAQRGRDMSYNLNFLPAKDHFPDLLRSINEVDHLQMVHQKINSIVMVPVWRSHPKEEIFIDSHDLYIQFFASTMDDRSFSELDHLGKVIVRRVQERDLYRYLLGQYETEEEVNTILIELYRLGFPDAFVVDDIQPK
jgi:hypothetical protein